MEEGRYFKEALASFAADAAYVGAVRHLYDSGLTPEEISENLTFPVSMEKIKKAIRDYEDEKRNKSPEYIYVQDVDSYGRRSFRLERKK